MSVITLEPSGPGDPGYLRASFAMASGRVVRTRWFNVWIDSFPESLYQWSMRLLTTYRAQREHEARGSAMLVSEIPIEMLQLSLELTEAIREANERAGGAGQAPPTPARETEAVTASG